VEQELNRQRSALPPDDFGQKRREFEQQVADVQRTVQARKRVLDQAFNESMTKVRDAVLQTVTEVAGEQKATLVLAKQQVVLAEKSLDLTSAVLDRVNRKLPSVSVTVPKS
jgi:Skp family chaperone for outer membrane proteins